MRIAIPLHSFYTPLVGGLDALTGQYSLTIRRGTEEECAKWLRANLVDLALLSPHGYGQGVLNSDYRMVPTTACVLRGWTQTGSIFFGKNLGDVPAIVSNTPHDFLMRCAHIVLDEQYGIEAEPQQEAGSVDELLANFPSVIAWHDNAMQSVGLDISEEWDMAFAHALPLAFWVCRSEFVLDGGAENNERENLIRSLTFSCTSAEYQAIEQCHEQSPVADTELREGQIDWAWTDDTEEVLNQTLQLLFFRQLLPEIPAIKLLGRD